MGVIKVIYGALQSHFEEAPSGVTRQLYGAVCHCRDSLHCQPRPPHTAALRSTCTKTHTHTDPQLYTYTRIIILNKHSGWCILLLLFLFFLPSIAPPTGPWDPLNPIFCRVIIIANAQE